MDRRAGEHADGADRRVGMPAALVLLTRVPVPGRAKTRLLPVLSGVQCAGLQRAMACDAAEALGALGLPVTVRCSDEAAGLPDGERLRAAFLAEVCACVVRGHAAAGDAMGETAPSRSGDAASVRVLPQEGDGLGARMHGALAAELAAGAPQCLLMGSDLPLVDAGVLRGALAAFGPDGAGGSAADVLLCPSDDGGYWLVGLREPFPELFAGKRYGAGGVLDEALAACRAHGRRAVLGPVARDVDTPDDLAWLADRVAAGDPRVGPRTAAWVRGYIR